MAAPWPVQFVTDPNYDTDFVTLTAALVVLPGANAGRMIVAGVYVQNPTSAEVVFSLQDANGKSIVPDVPVPPKGFMELNVATMMPITGAPKWKGLGLIGKFWGWQ